MLVNLVARACRWYWVSVPVHKGKGRILRVLQRFLASRPFVMRTSDGVRVEMRMGDTMCQQILHDHAWEADTVAVLRKVVRPGDTVLDVGANIGYLSALASRLVGEQGRVISFEPVPQTRGWLQRNLDLNHCRNAEIIPTALGESEGCVLLHLTEGKSLGHASRYAGWREPGEGVRVPVTTLDSFARERSLRAPTVVKVDVEGSEAAVFEGGRVFLGEQRPILCFEVSLGLSTAAGWDPVRLLDSLTAVGGYRFGLPQRAGLVPLVLERDLRSDDPEFAINVLGYCPDVPWHVERLGALASGPGSGGL